MARFARSHILLLPAVLFALLPGLALGASKKKPAKSPARSTSHKPEPKPTPKPTPKPAAKIPPRETMRLLAEGELPLAAKGAIVLDADTGATLYEKNADEAQYPASTTKIMTALLVIEAGELDRVVTVELEDQVGESNLAIKAGEQYPRRQMLYGLMLKSANDVAHALGRDNAGTIAAFAEKMTARAEELGTKNTLFANPHGLHDAEHYTSPRDLAKIARAAMKQPFFRELVATRAHVWNRPGGTRLLDNHNKLLWNFPGCTGVKTGYTWPAQQVLVSAAMRDGREVIAVVMHDDKPGVWEDSKLLLTYGLDHPPVGKSLKAVVPSGSFGGN